MKKLFVVCSLMLALIGTMAVQAEATPILGAISFSGTSTNSAENLTVASAFTAFSNVVVSGTGGTGDYSAVGAGQAVDFTPFAFRPALSPNPLVPLWTFEFSGDTYSFDATSLVITNSTYNTIAMYGTGIAYITGFDDTPSNWYFSANAAGQTASFSASADNTASVSEPATMLLLGAGLIGLAGITRKKCKKA